MANRSFSASVLLQNTRQHNKAHGRSKSSIGQAAACIPSINVIAAQELVNAQRAPQIMGMSMGDMTPDSASSDASMSSDEGSKQRFRGLRHWISDLNLKRTGSEHKQNAGTNRMHRLNTGSSQSLRSRFNNLDAPFIRRSNSPLSASSTSLATTPSQLDESVAGDQKEREVQLALFLDASIYEYSDTLHHVFKYYLGQIYFASIDCAATSKPQRILNMDCGGTDIWAREMACMYPTADVWNMSERIDNPNYGFKRPRRQSLTFSLSNSSPPNLHFTDNKLSNVSSWSGELFDYVHRRFFHPLLADSRWSAIIPEMFQVCRPGGFVELSSIELDFVDVNNNPEAADFKRVLSSLLHKLGLQHDGSLKFEQILANAGFIHINRQTHYLPCGQWGDLTGRLLEGILRDTFSSIPPFHACLQQLNEWRSHFCFTVYTAQKPEQAFDEISMYPAV
ncbi:hypothetical protein BDF19DRAFT_467014 [Syncephalis fuscata]|nr:hypothetical protein BDF19DRAFT_467014 [Syncephalis fuscata]